MSSTTGQSACFAPGGQKKGISLFDRANLCLWHVRSHFVTRPFLPFTDPWQTFRCSLVEYRREQQHSELTCHCIHCNRPTSDAPSKYCGPERIEGANNLFPYARGPRVVARGNRRVCSTEVPRYGYYHASFTATGTFSEIVNRESYRRDFRFSVLLLTSDEWREASSSVFLKIILWTLICLVSFPYFSTTSE